MENIEHIISYLKFGTDENKKIQLENDLFQKIVFPLKWQLGIFSKKEIQITSIDKIEGILFYLNSLENGRLNAKFVDLLINTGKWVAHKCNSGNYEQYKNFIEKFQWEFSQFCTDKLKYNTKEIEQKLREIGKKFEKCIYEFDKKQN